MERRIGKRRGLSAQLPKDLLDELVSYSLQSGYNKGQVIISALKQYLAIKNEERAFKQEHPGRRVKTRVVLEALPAHDEAQKAASVLIY